MKLKKVMDEKSGQSKEKNYRRATILARAFSASASNYECVKVSFLQM